ncbi:hypothetical protein [Deinococcus knuensis]|uniref:Uncharacterized protein n=1 Tax=Deinococcus knuensis TaxID=1837380 RepID=A0ABQ2SW48_9DEIO|nr:hypothetical protein [Deinococcus knuensis]GGS42277.1 hypothetical protein GCM10008961_36820 [Deinococcus knuensis]
MNWTPALRFLLLLLLALSGRAAAFTPSQYQIYCGFPFYDATQWQLTPNWAARWNTLGAKAGIPDLGTQLSGGLATAGKVRQAVSNAVASGLIGNEGTQQYYDAWYSGPVLRQLTALGITDPDFGLSTAGGIAQQSLPNDCLSAERRQKLEGYAAQAMAGYQKLGFASPGGKNLGPVVQVGTRRAVRLYVLPPELYDGSANTSGRCQTDGKIQRDNLSFVKINANELRGSDAKAFYIVAHELFHVVQAAQGLETRPGLDRCDLIHHWLNEGMADALALQLTRERFPDYRPGLSDDIGLNFYGLRSMSLSLPQPHAPTPSDLRNYRASSFWRHLADRYHGGNYAFYAQYLDLPETNAGRDDWLNHADILVSRDAAVTIAPEQQQAGRNGLYLTLPDFYTEYATWGTEKFPWIGDAAWMKQAFAPCQTVTLDATTSRSQTLTFADMLPFSARCVRVKVTGVQAGQRFSVVPMTGPLGNGLADELHLGRARSGGLKAFNCYQNFSVKQLGQTLHPGCLFKPFTSATPGTRLWLAEADELAPGRSSVEYLWVLSWVPPDASDRQLTRRASPTLVLGLDVTTLTSALPPSPPVRSAAGAPVRKRVVGTVNFESPGGAQELPPLKGAEQTGLTGGLDLGKLAFGVQDPGMGALNRAAQDATDGDLYSLAVSLADVSFGPVSFGGLSAVQENFESDGDLLGIFPERAINFGQTGTFRARVQGGNNQATESPMSRLYITPPGPDGLPGPGLTLTVTQFDRAALIVQFSGVVCSVPWPPPPTRPLAEYLKAACAATYPVSGTIVKPHGFLYSRAGALTVSETPGTRLYRQDLLAFLNRAMPGLNTLPGMPGQPVPGGGNGGAPGGTGGGGSSGIAGSTGACPLSDQQLLDFLTYSDDPGDGPPPFDLSVIGALSNPACIKRLTELQPQEP